MSNHLKSVSRLNMFTYWWSRLSIESILYSQCLSFTPKFLNDTKWWANRNFYLHLHCTSVGRPTWYQIGPRKFFRLYGRDEVNLDYVNVIKSFLPRIAFRTIKSSGQMQNSSNCHSWVSFKDLVKVASLSVSSWISGLESEAVMKR